MNKDKVRHATAYAEGFLYGRHGGCLRAAWAGAIHEYPDRTVSRISAFAAVFIRLKVSGCYRGMSYDEMMRRGIGKEG